MGGWMNQIFSTFQKGRDGWNDGRSREKKTASFYERACTFLLECTERASHFRGVPRQGVH